MYSDSNIKINDSNVYIDRAAKFSSCMKEPHVITVAIQKNYTVLENFRSAFDIFTKRIEEKRNHIGYLL